MNLSNNPFYLNGEQIKWVEDTLFSLTTEQKVGQLFCPEAGRYSPEELNRLITEYYIGGVLYRSTPSEKLKKLYDDIEGKASVPLLHAANLETGGIGAVSDGTHFANPMGVAAANTPEITEKFALTCAVEGLNSGVNWSFSPVVDININPHNPITHIRAFSDETQKVIENASVFVKTMQGEGMAACIKHFPGDGVDFRDQHLHPTYNTLSSKDWYDSFGRVYKTLIDEGALSIMAGHICQPEVTRLKNPSLADEEILPASICPELLTGVLREEFGFGGVITTDATVMAGYFQLAEERESLLSKSIEAGCDMLLFSDDFYKDYDAVLTAVKNGTLTETRLNEAVTRILALKARVCGKNAKTKIEPEKWSRECAKKAVTLVKNNARALPISKEKGVKVCVFGSDDIEGESLAEFSKEYLIKKGFSAEIYDRKADKNTKDTVLVLANYGSASGKVAVRLFWNETQFNSNFAARENVIFVSLGYPYHLMDVPRAKTFINAYSPNKVTVEETINKIIGEGNFSGESPVDAFCGLADTRL